MSECFILEAKARLGRALLRKKKETYGFGMSEVLYTKMTYQDPVIKVFIVGALILKNKIKWDTLH